MALRIDYTDQGTAAGYTSAYLRVLPSSIHLDFDKQHGEFDVAVYVSKNASDVGKADVARRHFVVEGPDFVNAFGNTVINRAYGYLKTLPEFSGAADT